MGSGLRAEVKGFRGSSSHAFAGELQSVALVEDGALEPAEGAVRESWMHIEIARVPDDEDTGEIEEALLAVLRDVRESVEDWGKMNAQLQALVDELDADALAEAASRSVVRVEPPPFLLR